MLLKSASAIAGTVESLVLLLVVVAVVFLRRALSPVCDTVTVSRPSN